MSTVTLMPETRAVTTRIAMAAIAALAVGAAGSRGLPLPASSELSDRVIAAVAEAPPWIGHGFEVVSELGLVVLAGAWLLLAWRHRRHPTRLARSAAGGLGVVAAYAGSEALKVAIGQPRPCHVLDLDPVTTVASCPPVTDWSLPSNHATIAMALAVALVFARPRTARWAVPLALTVAAARVVIGVHYPHDVGTGLLLAVGVVTVAVVTMERPLGAVLGRRLPST